MEKQKQTKPSSKFDALMERRPVQVAVGVISLGLTFLFTSLAIDSGSLLDYAIAIVSLFLGISELAMALLGKKKA